VLFSSKNSTRRVPGTGTTSSALDSGHARATWPGVASSSVPMARRTSTVVTFRSKLPSAYLGTWRRWSFSARSSRAVTAPVSTPRPNGL